jgi:signal transduction histidine kinase
MTTVLGDLPAALGYSRELAALLEATREDPVQRAVRLAERLHAAWPAPVTACFLAAGCVLDHAGQRQAAWEEALSEVFSRRVDPAGPARAVPWPAGLELPGQVLIAAPVAFRDRHHGTLAVAAAGPERAAETSPTALVLTQWAERLGLLLDLEQQEQLRESLRGQLARQARLTTVGELAGLVAHEFNNALNGIVLHVAVIGLDAPEKLRNELGVIRQLAANAAMLVRKLQQFSRQQRPALSPVDLNAVVRGSARDAAGTTITLDLAADLPTILGIEAELRRILDLLLAHAAAAMAPAPGTVTIRTRGVDRKVVLRVEDGGPKVDEEALPQLFEPFSTIRPGSNGSDLPICKALVRRLQGSLQAENRPEGGLAFVAEWPAAPAELERPA